MTTKEINAINTVEGIAQRLIDDSDMWSIKAMRDAVNRALLPGVFMAETFKALEAFRDAMALTT